jgi:hypothetical protein
LCPPDRPCSVVDDEDDAGALFLGVDGDFRAAENEDEDDDEEEKEDTRGAKAAAKDG